MPYADKDRNRECKRLWRRAKRAAWMSERVCVQCGATEQLEIHHIDPATKITSAMWDRNQEFLDTELAKCEVLCRACHRVKTTAYLRAKALARTTCIHGHEMTPENTYWRKGGRKRECRTCVLASQRRRWEPRQQRAA